jgi:hypothetical protein
MLKILAATPLLIAATFATPAQAQHHHHHGGGGWVAPFIGGALVGGALGYAAPHYYGGYGAYPSYYYAPPPAYYAPPAYSWCYDYYGRPYRCGW